MLEMLPEILVGFIEVNLDPDIGNVCSVLKITVSEPFTLPLGTEPINLVQCYMRQ